MMHQPPLIEAAHRHADRRALIAPEGVRTYAELLHQSARVAATLLAGAADLEEARVVFLVPGGIDYVALQWGIWRAGGIAVPLALTETEREIAYKVGDAAPAALVAAPEYADQLRGVAGELDIPLHTTDQVAATQPAELPAVGPTRRAMLLYTSGTTSEPKGVVSTHAMIAAQVASLVEAWQWSADDHILDHLPLHHVHGIINAMACAFQVGATCQVLPRFDAGQVWQRLGDGQLTLYMAVPTVYRALIAAYERFPAAEQHRLRTACERLRLMVSGSDALPVDTFTRWEELTGHRLLERYGMTEIGMGLSNPLHGERVPGHVGRPLPGVQVRLRSFDTAHFEATGELTYTGEPAGDQPGELQVRGPGVFGEYWRKPEATAAAFTDDGWFRTGDVASLRADGSYRIWGRASQDLIITGGENVSALEVQRELLAHPHIEQCAVVGVPDPYWGTAVAVALVLTAGASLDRETLRDWARDRLAAHKLPQQVLTVAELPRNAMGKIVKPRVRALFGGAG